MNFALESIFRAFTKGGVTSEHCDSSFWFGVTRDNEIAQLNDVGHDECRVLAARSLEEFESSHARRASKKAKPVRAKNNKPAKKEIPVNDLDKDAEDEDEDDDKDDDDDGDDEPGQDDAGGGEDKGDSSTRKKKKAAKSALGRSPAVAALVARCEQAIADPLADASTKKMARASLRQVGAAPTHTIEVHDQDVTGASSFSYVEGKRVTR